MTSATASIVAQHAAALLGLPTPPGDTDDDVMRLTLRCIFGDDVMQRDPRWISTRFSALAPDDPRCARVRRQMAATAQRTAPAKP